MPEPIEVIQDKLTAAGRARADLPSGRNDSIGFRVSVSPNGW